MSLMTTHLSLDCQLLQLLLESLHHLLEVLFFLFQLCLHFLHSLLLQLHAADQLLFPRLQLLARGKYHVHMREEFRKNQKYSYVTLLFHRIRQAQTPCLYTCSSYHAIWQWNAEIALFLVHCISLQWLDVFV